MTNKCEDCNQPYGKKSCLRKIGKYNRIPYGIEITIGERYEADRERTCHDCGVAFNGFHHRDCDWERCPKCCNQLLGCGCDLDKYD